MTRAIVFDLDGTLIDSLPDMTASTNTLLVEEGLPPLDPSVVAGFVGSGVRVFIDRLIGASDLQASQYDDLMERFMALYVEATDHTEVFPHVIETLQALRNDGYALGICTNKPTAPMNAVLKAVGLDTVLDVAVAGDTLIQRKPDPEPLHHAFRQLGATQGVYVGDSDVDAETAQRAEVPFAFFTEGIRTKSIADIPHDAAFGDFRELPAICDGLMRPI